VAILPFENLTEDENAAKVVEELFAKELYRSGGYKVLDRSEAESRLTAKQVGTPRAPDRATLMQIAKVLAVDGLFYGSVLEYAYLSEVRDGTVIGREPAVGLQIRLFDGKRGEVVWAGSHARSSFAMVVSNQDSLSQIAAIAIDQLVADLRSPSEP
jgi:TolB-like protein